MKPGPYCGSVAPEGGWLCLLLKGHDDEECLSIDNTVVWRGSPGRPVRWRRTMVAIPSPVAGLSVFPSPTGLGPPDDGLPYTGNQCSNCDSMRLIREGRCDKCLDCGTTSGCG